MKRLLLSLIIALSVQANAQVTIDGYTYSTVVINNREWMSENLKATKWESGTTFQTVTTNQLLTAPVTTNIQSGPYSTPAMIEPAWSSANGNGKLYNYSIVYNQSQVIKYGWRLATKQEWLDMIAFTNASTTDNMRKVEPNTSVNYWNCAGNFLDQYGFSAIGVGRVVVNSTNTTATMDFIGDGAFFWCVANGQDGADVSYVNINCNGIVSGQYMNANNVINRRSALSVRLIRDAPLSVGNIEKSKVSVYPNPIQNEMNIESPEVINSVEIFDLLGKQILISKSKTIDVGALQKGIYIVRINTDSGILIEKIIKQ